MLKLDFALLNAKPTPPIYPPYPPGGVIADPDIRG